MLFEFENSKISEALNDKPLPVQLTFYVPFSDHVPLAQNEAMLDRLCEDCALTFGGYTVTKSRGGWYDNEIESVIDETVYLINVSIGEITDHVADFIKDAIFLIETELQQKAVSIKVNESLYIV